MAKTSPQSVDFSILPSVDQLLQVASDLTLPHLFVKEMARQFIEDQRHGLKKGKDLAGQDLSALFRTELASKADPIRQVINGTGVVIHTNLGRAPMSKKAYDSLSLLKDQYVNLELDLKTGKRGSRHDHLRPWIQALTGAENGLLVNNNAAAVLLALNSLADRKEVIISRGQLVEIGGSFRIPEILKKAGGKLIEVGTTNRTHLRDYEEAITSRTRLLLWVHSSNYKISGFTKEVELSQLVELGNKHNIPVMADLGSGALVDIGSLGLQREPLVSEIIKAGVDLVTFSVDKLLGGPQGGIIAGSAELLKRIEKNNLLRALRPDKIQLLLCLEAFQNYGADTELPEDLPIYRDLTCSVKDLEHRAQGIISDLKNPRLTVESVETESQVGSGASPTETIPSLGLKLTHTRLKAQGISRVLRCSRPSLLGRIMNEHYVIDLRAVRQAEDETVAKLLNQIS